MIVLGEGGGRFRLGAVRARGGQGVVYDAVDEVDGRAVVVKVSLTPGAPAESFRAAALRLAALAEDPVAGPHLVPVWDVGTWDDRPFVVLERLEATLEQHLARGGSRDDAARGVLRAAAALDRAGVVHGDIKPSNTFVVGDAEDLVALFGDLWCGSGPASVSPGFSPPEAWRGEAPTPAADRYALGATLHATFEGSPPACAASGLAPRRPRPDELAPLPETARPMIARLLDPVPSRRPPPADVLRALDVVGPAVRPAPARWLAAAALGGAVAVGWSWWAPPAASGCPSPFTPDGIGCRAPDGRRVVRVPAGSFVAGRKDAAEASWAVDARPVEVELTRDVWFRTTEVTQGEYRARLGEEPVATRTETLPDGSVVPCASWEGHALVDDALPVACVDWWDGVALANATSVMDGLPPAYVVEELPDGTRVARWDRSSRGWRLPTEAEWEWAARGAGADQRWAGAPARDAICGHANVRDASAPEAWGNEVSCSDATPVLAPVGSYAPNALGLHDVLGNVAEWTWDRYGDRPSTSLVDPAGPEVGPHRVYRGGGWNQIARPVAARYGDRPAGRGLNLGIRLVRDADPG